MIGTSSFNQRGVNKVITTRSKLKGRWIIASAPTLINLIHDRDNIDETIQNDEKASCFCYNSVILNENIAKIYYIPTKGCQMNTVHSLLAGALDNK